MRGNSSSEWDDSKKQMVKGGSENPNWDGKDWKSRNRYSKWDEPHPNREWISRNANNDCDRVENLSVNTTVVLVYINGERKKKNPNSEGDENNS